MQPDSPHHGLDAILRPRSVAVIGAGRRDGSIGREILKNLVRFGFEGPVHPVHPDAGHVLSMRAWPSIEAVPDPVDLAVIAVPAAQVADVVRACAARARAWWSSRPGFGKRPAGRALEAEVLAIVRSHGMRMVGPNCMAPSTPIRR
ncbi:MAG: CoA-binding protein [bacterium]